MSRYIKPYTIAGVPFHQVALDNKDMLKVSLLTTAMVAPFAGYAAFRALSSRNDRLRKEIADLRIEVGEVAALCRWTNYYKALEAL